MRQLKIVALVALGCLMVAPCNAQVVDRDVATVQFVLDLFQMNAEIDIERVPQSVMQDWNRDQMVNQCMAGVNPFHPSVRAIRAGCRARANSAQFFLHGRVDIQDNNINLLHIVLDEDAGNDVLIHEVLHFVLVNSTNPRYIANNEQIVQLLTMNIMTSRHYTDWLRERE